MAEEIITEDYCYDTGDIKKDKALILIIYDIVDNKRRTGLVKFLLGYGSRVQKSAFEAIVTRKQYQQILDKIPRYAKPEDSIRIYRIVGHSEVKVFGINVECDEEDVIIM